MTYKTYIKWEGNIKMDLKTGWEGLESSDLAQNKVTHQVFVFGDENQVSTACVEFYAIGGSISLSRGTLLHGCSQFSDKKYDHSQRLGAGTRFETSFFIKKQENRQYIKNELISSAIKM